MQLQETSIPGPEHDGLACPYPPCELLSVLGTWHRVTDQDIFIRTCC